MAGLYFFINSSFVAIAFSGRAINSIRLATKTDPEAVWTVLAGTGCVASLIGESHGWLVRCRFGCSI
jgi:hypothetical protein